MSSSDIFAEPMLDTQDFLKKYRDQLNELKKKGLLPKPDLKLNYKVYSIRGSEFGAHKSIVLTTDDEHFFTVELGLRTVNGKKHIYPVTRPKDKSALAKMEYLGMIEATGQELIGKAVAVMKEFGSYFKLCNNCQNYCNMYVEAIGLKHAQKLTDRDKAAIAGLLAAIVAFLFAAMRWINSTFNRALRPLRIALYFYWLLAVSLTLLSYCSWTAFPFLFYCLSQSETGTGRK